MAKTTGMAPPPRFGGKMGKAKMAGGRKSKGFGSKSVGMGKGGGRIDSPAKCK